MDDNQIINCFFDRSEDAIQMLSVKYGGICAHTAQNILENEEDAQECINDAYLAVWNTIPPARPQSLLSYLLRILRNISLNRRAYNQAAKRAGNFQVCIDELQWCLAGGDPPDELYDAKLLSDYLNDFLSGLSKPDRLLFVRRYWYMDSYEYLARNLGISPGAVRTRLSRLRQKLKHYLSERGVTL